MGRNEIEQSTKSEMESEILDLGLGWRVGNGECIDFWDDVWLGDQTVSELLPVNSTLEAIPVSHLITDAGTWDRQLLTDMLARHVVNKVLGIVLPSRPTPDMVVWKLHKSGCYTTKSGYQAAMGFSNHRSMALKRLWRNPGPAKWVTLLWLIRRNRLHSQQLRFHRGIGGSALCTRCGEEVEDSLHIIRDCRFARQLWQRFISPDKWSSWATDDVEEWVDNNLDFNSSRFGSHFPWNVLFSAIVWYSWKWRCMSLFQEDFEFPFDPWHMIILDVRDVCRVWKLDDNHGVPKICKMICWQPPPGDMIKLNTDGASRGNPGVAGFGGLFRDTNGRFVLGFSGSLGISSTIIAELAAIRAGLFLAWSRGFRVGILEADSTSALELLESHDTRRDEVGLLVQEIKELLARDWRWALQHQFREGNACADTLANMGADGILQLVVHEEVPTALSLNLLNDASGVAYPRLVPQPLQG